MTILNTRAAEPLYIISLRNQQAESLLKSWIKEFKIEHASVNGNKMMLHCQYAFDRFLITWNHSWDSISVWDTWNRRPVYL